MNLKHMDTATHTSTFGRVGIYASKSNSSRASILHHTLQCCQMGLCCQPVDILFLPVATACCHECMCSPSLNARYPNHSAGPHPELFCFSRLQCPGPRQDWRRSGRTQFRAFSRMPLPHSPYNHGKKSTCSLKAALTQGAVEWSLAIPLYRVP